MAYTLKTTGLATHLIHCIGVDDDGAIKDFVGGSSVTISDDTGVTKSAEQWRSATSNASSHRYFQTGATSFVTFGTKPTFGLGGSRSIFVAFAGTGGTTRDQNYPSHMFGVSTSDRVYAASFANHVISVASSTIAMTTNEAVGNTITGQHSLAYCTLNSGTYQSYYDAAASMASGNSSNSTFTFQPTLIGCESAGSTNNRMVLRYSLICQFDTYLPTYDANAVADLNTDWFGALFEGSASPVPMGNSVF